MSKEDDDDARLHRCFKKYQEIVKQVVVLDELTQSMEPRTRLSKRKRDGDNSDGSVSDRDSFDQVVVQTITKFLHDLNINNPKSSNQ